jgi:type II secretion system protein J
MIARDGFTLLEILVAISLTAALMLASYQIFSQITASLERARPDRHRDPTALIFLDRIERELVGTTLIEKPEDEDRLGFPWLFIGEDRVLASSDADGIRFVTRSPARAPGGGGGGLRMVSYAVGDAEEFGRLDLFRVEEALPAGMEKQIRTADGEAVLEDVARFSLRFRNEETGEWRDLWDSTDISVLDQLPRTIEVALQLNEIGADGEIVPGQEHQRLIDLPVRPIPAVAPDDDDLGGCETGLSVDECLDLYFEDINQLPEQDQAMLQTEANTAGDVCWNSDTPSTDLAALHEDFTNLVGIDAAEACR